MKKIIFFVLSITFLFIVSHLEAKKIKYETIEYSLPNNFTKVDCFNPTINKKCHMYRHSGRYTQSEDLPMTAVLAVVIEDQDFKSSDMLDSQKRLMKLETIKQVTEFIAFEKYNTQIFAVNYLLRDNNITWWISSFAWVWKGKGYVFELKIPYSPSHKEYINLKMIMTGVVRKFLKTLVFN